MPQGSVLGPILYLIYINDVGHVNLGSKELMFADDSVLIHSHLDPCVAISNLKKDSQVITGYFEGLKLRLNKNKTKILNVDRRTKQTTANLFPALVIDDITIETVEVFSYLGVKIDNQLKMNSHLSNCVKRAYCKLYLLGKIQRFMDKKKLY